MAILTNSYDLARSQDREDKAWGGVPRSYQCFAVRVDTVLGLYIVEGSAVVRGAPKSIAVFPVAVAERVFVWSLVGVKEKSRGLFARAAPGRIVSDRVCGWRLFVDRGALAWVSFGRSHPGAGVVGPSPGEVSSACQMRNRNCCG